MRHLFLLITVIASSCLCACSAYILTAKIATAHTMGTYRAVAKRVPSMNDILSINVAEPPVIRYLEKELQLSDEVLRKIILRFPWILYLQVTTNLRPTVEVFHAFGFKICEIRNIVSQAPSVLAINCKWTLPEKLISIQKMFHLSQDTLIRVVISQPYLLTSSIDRNYRTANFLTNVAQFTELEVQRLITADPRIAMSSVSILQRCWSVLTKLYGIQAAEARSLILRYPLLLSSKLMKNIKERLIIFSSELNAESFPSEFVQALAHRFPPILYIDTAVFVKPNLDILKELLSTKFAGAESLGSVKYKRIYELLRPVRLEDQRIASRFNRTELVEAARHLLEDSVHHNVVLLVKTFPQLLAYNPAKLRLMCANALYFLTGERPVDFASSVLLPTADSTATASELQVPLSGADKSVDSDSLDPPIFVDFETEAREHDTHDDPADSTEGTICDTTVEAECREEIDVVEEWYNSSGSDEGLRALPAFDLIADIVLSPPRQLKLAATAQPHIAEDSSAADYSADYSTDYSTDNPRITTDAQVRALQVFARQGGSLSLDMTRAVHILRTAPWILSYRIVRSQRVLAALAVSLGMSNAELSKCVQTYPRFLSLSIEGKISAVLRTLAAFAADYLLQHPPPQVSSLGYATATDELKTDVVNNLFRTARQDCANTPATLIQAVAALRSEPVRTLVRELVIRYPLILGTSLERVQDRFASAAAAGLTWSDYLKLLRWRQERFDKYKRTLTDGAKHKILLKVPPLPPISAPIDSEGCSADLTALCATECTEPTLATRRTVSEEAVVPKPPMAASTAPKLNNPRPAPVRKSPRRKPPLGVGAASEMRKRRKRGSSGSSSTDNEGLRHIVSAKDARFFEPYPDALKLQSMFANQRRSVQRSAYKLIDDMLPY